jgi:MFS family permease
MTSSSRQRSGVATAFDHVVVHATVVLATVGLGIILALLADLQRTIGFGSSALGVVAGSSFFCAFLSYLTLARFADLGHARLMLLAGTAAAAAALVAAAYSTSVVWLVCARALLGLAEGAVIPAARRIVLDWSPDRPGVVLGRILSASVAGFVAGPAIGALLAAPFGLRVPFLVPAAVLVVTLPVISRLSVPAAVRDGRARFETRLLASPLVAGGVLLGVVDFAMFGALDSVWARMLTDTGASTSFIGISLTIIVLPMVPAATWFGHVVDRTSSRFAAMLGVGLIVPAVALYAVATDKFVIAVAGLVHGLGSAALAPAAAAMVAAGSPRTALARGQGLLEASGYLAAAASALPAGWIYAHAGKATLFWGLAAVALCVYIAARAVVARSAGLSR